MFVPVNIFKGILFIKKTDQPIYRRRESHHIKIKLSFSSNPYLSLSLISLLKTTTTWDTIGYVFKNDVEVSNIFFQTKEFARETIPNR